jgi:superfamily II DNA or RNA helicase
MGTTIRATYDRGTLLVEAPAGVTVPGALWDPRSESLRAPAHRLHALVGEAGQRGLDLEGDPRPTWRLGRTGTIDAALQLRPYQAQALAAWRTFDRRGLVCLPTGAGKTRVAIAAIREERVTAAVLCPTRALAAAWVVELERWGLGPVGLFADGEKRLGDVTVMTFESAYRQMDRFGDRFGMLIVDEAHHFGAAGRAEALECCAATARMGLSATPPPERSVGRERLDWLVGPVVFEIGFEALVGTHLAQLSVVRRSVRLEADERAAYERGVEPFLALRRTFLRSNPGADYVMLARVLSASPEGRRAMRAHGAALALASFPAAKRAVVSELLTLHKEDKCVVFTAFVDNAYAVALDNLIPVVAAETTAKERATILEAFREGRVRAVAAARVLNEGIDIPDANVAIIVAGSLGRREHVQRIGRVLRKAEGKVARVYELVTHQTSDARRADARGPVC